MSQYKYKFVKGNEVVESTGYNPINGAENAGIRVVSMTKHGHSYLRDTKFEERVTKICGVEKDKCTSDIYHVHQSYNN